MKDDMFPLFAILEHNVLENVYIVHTIYIYSQMYLLCNGGDDTRSFVVKNLIVPP